MLPISLPASPWIFVSCPRICQNEWPSSLLYSRLPIKITATLSWLDELLTTRMLVTRSWILRVAIRTIRLLLRFYCGSRSRPTGAWNCCSEINLCGVSFVSRRLSSCLLLQDGNAISFLLFSSAILFGQFCHDWSVRGKWRCLRPWYVFMARFLTARGNNGILDSLTERWNALALIYVTFPLIFFVPMEI